MEKIEQPRSLVEQTHDILLEAICSGEFEPGQRLHQDDIATRLKVSRQPVNSAISVLKANGFVEDTGRRGVVVSQISVDQFLSIYEFRTALEPFALRLAHERKPPHAARQAEEILKRGWEAVRSQIPQAQIERDFEFHKMIYGWAGNPTITEALRTNWHHIRRSMGVVLRGGVASEKSWEEHERIIDAFMRGDLARAEAEMEKHVLRAKEKTLSLLT